LPAEGAGVGEGVDAGGGLVSTDEEDEESSLAETRRVTPRDAMGETRGETRSWRGADRARARRAPDFARTRAATGAVTQIISREARREVRNRLREGCHPTLGEEREEIQKIFLSPACDFELLSCGLSRMGIESHIVVTTKSGANHVAKLLIVK